MLTTKISKKSRLILMPLLKLDTTLKGSAAMQPVCLRTFSAPLHAHSLSTMHPQQRQMNSGNHPRRTFYKAVKAQLDPQKMLQNIVALRSKGWMRTKGWSEGFSAFQWGNGPAQQHVAEEASQHGQMAPPEVLSPGSRIADDYEPRRLRKALQDGTLSFGFSAGGLLFPFLVGVLYELQSLGIITERTKLAGASAGSIVAACFHSGLTKDQVIEGFLALAHDCRKNGTRHRIALVLQDSLHTMMPKDAHHRCGDKAFVAVTQAFPRPRSVLVSQYHSKSDLVHAVLTSCHVPWWFSGRLMTDFRGKFHYDGGLTNFIPIAPMTEGVRVSCFPAGQLATISGIAISPDAYGEWPHDLSQMLEWAFEPGDERTLMYLIEHGAKQGRSWAQHHGLLDAVSSSDDEPVALQQDAALL